MLCLASLGGLLPDDGERLYDVAWDAPAKQVVVARSMPETAAQGKVPSWDVTRSKEMAPTALHLIGLFSPQWLFPSKMNRLMLLLL